MAWRPIETAPLDGAEVDLFLMGVGRKTDCHFHCGQWLKWGYEEDEEGHWEHVDDATHWMPIPAPPLASGADCD